MLVHFEAPSLEVKRRLVDTVETELLILGWQELPQGGQELWMGSVNTDKGDTCEHSEDHSVE